MQWRPLYMEHQKHAFFRIVWSFDLADCPSRKSGHGEAWWVLWKLFLSTWIFWPLWLLPALLLLPGAPCVFILHGSFQLTHFVSVIRQTEGVKITGSVVSHSFRSTGLLSKIALSDCSAWGIIDQSQVCTLLYIWLVNLTPHVLILYAVSVHISGLSSQHIY